jgi:hypothetical protein
LVHLTNKQPVRIEEKQEPELTLKQPPTDPSPTKHSKGNNTSLLAIASTASFAAAYRSQQIWGAALPSRTVAWIGSTMAEAKNRGAPGGGEDRNEQQMDKENRCSPFSAQERDYARLWTNGGEP